MLPYRPSLRFACSIAAAALGWSVTGGALAQHKAHSHGTVSLDVAVDARAITVVLDSPLDDLVGFERAPRTDAERQRVADMVARFNAADQLFRIDPTARCTLSAARLKSAVLGLDDAPAAGDSGTGAAGKDSSGNQAHADLTGTFVFACQDGDKARFIDLGLFDAFKGIRIVNTQVVSPQGQFKRALRKKQPRLSWGS